jgi:hypothetical protein
MNHGDTEDTEKKQEEVNREWTRIDANDIMVIFGCGCPSKVDIQN